MSDIAPGTRVTLKVVKQPTNAAAVKTLVRLLSKDANAKQHNARHRGIRKRAQTMSPRGGRWRVWESRLAKQHPVKGTLGEQGTLVASVDVLRDLKSVARFVDVQAS